MPRTKKEPVDPEKVRRWVKELTDPKIVNTYCGIMTAVGGALLMRAYVYSMALGWKDEETENNAKLFAESVTSSLTSGTTSSLTGGAMTLEPIKQRTMKDAQVKLLFKWNLDKVKAVSEEIKKIEGYIRNFEKSIAEKDRRYRERDLSNITDKQKAIDDAEYKRSRKALVDAMQVYIDNLASVKASVAPYEDNVEYLLWGWSLVGAGAGLWIANNPKVVEEFIDAVEKVSIRAIDESSEIIGQTGKWTQAALKELVPWFWS